MHSFQSIIRIGTFIRSVVIDNLSAGIEREHIGKATRCVGDLYADSEADLARREGTYPPEPAQNTLLHVSHRLSIHSLRLTYT